MDEEDIEIFSFDVLWRGWEMDNTAWVMQKKDGSRYLKTTNHGMAYVASKKELEDRINEYNRVLTSSNKALEMLI